MYANGDKSICTEFDNAEDNIIYPSTEHTWDKNSRCEICGDNKSNYDVVEGFNKETYAYPFIHGNFNKEFGNMKFDVIIGNPPYQMSEGSESSPINSATAIYHLFIDKALELNPKYISMITPSRWMGRSAKGISNDWIDRIMSDKRFKELHDFMNSEDCFNQVVIRGGVNYFLWDRDYTGKCSFHQHSKGGKIKVNKDYLNSRNSGIVVRDINSLSIVDKICKIEKGYLEDNSKNFSSMVSPKGLFISELNIDQKLAGSWKGFFIKKDDIHTIKYYTSKYLNGTNIGWIKKDDVLKNVETIGLHKIYINSAGDNEKFGRVLVVPRYSEPNSICSGTYLIIGYDSNAHNFTKKECFNIMSYIKTKFFRFLVDIKKTSQHCSRGVYQFVPLQDWSKPWTDAELYAKYNLSEEEIAYIEENITPMGGQEDLDDLEVDKEYLDDFGDDNE